MQMLCNEYKFYFISLRVFIFYTDEHQQGVNLRFIDQHFLFAFDFHGICITAPPTIAGYKIQSTAQIAFLHLQIWQAWAFYSIR